MTIEEKLASIGLKKNEIKVYLSSLELGEPLVGQIEKDIGLHKQLIYHAANSLESKNLLSVVEIRGRKRFRITNPGALEEQARQRHQLTKNLIPELFKIANKKKTEDKIRTYKGINGIHQYYLERIRAQSPKSTIRILGVNSQRYFEIFDPHGIAWTRFEDTRTKKEIKAHLLLFGDQENEAELNKNRKHIELRLLEDSIEAPMDVVIWDTSVGMIFYSDEPYILDIMGKDTVDGYQGYFNVLWKQADRLKKI